LGRPYSHQDIILQQQQQLDLMGNLLQNVLCGNLSGSATVANLAGLQGYASPPANQAGNMAQRHDIPFGFGSGKTPSQPEEFESGVPRNVPSRMPGGAKINHVEGSVLVPEEYAPSLRKPKLGFKNRRATSKPDHNISKAKAIATRNSQRVAVSQIGVSSAGLVESDASNGKKSPENEGQLFSILTSIGTMPPPYRFFLRCLEKHVELLQKELQLLRLKVSKLEQHEHFQQENGPHSLPEIPNAQSTSPLEGIVRNVDMQVFPLFLNVCFLTR
jgi:hypothetical protein